MHLTLVRSGRSYRLDLSCHTEAMVSMQRIAAIDVGSNALRMIVGNINRKGEVKPIENIRLPVRLGCDAFTSGHLREVTLQQAMNAFLHFRRVADGLGVTHIRAIATSALREASNSNMLLDRILRSSGIEIEIISGEEEARLIHRAVQHTIDLKNKRAVLIDIGGGSVEVTISHNNTLVSTESYDVGTVRLLNTLGRYGDEKGIPCPVSELPLSQYVRTYAGAVRRRIDREMGKGMIHLCIGTGGNVERIGKLRKQLFKKSTDTTITLSELQALITTLSRMSVQDRINTLKLRPDRADVILPAVIVFHLLATEVRARRIHIPGVGLKDGMLIDMAEQLMRGAMA